MIFATATDGLRGGKRQGKAREWSRGLRGESGVVAIIVALAMVALLTLVALVVDLGGLYVHDRQLQTAADAGALAGAQALVESVDPTGRARDLAQEYVSKNLALDSSNVTERLTIADRSVTVGLSENPVPFAFAPVIGRTEGSVTAQATAEIMYLTSVDGLFPVALPMFNFAYFRIAYGDGAHALHYNLDNQGDGRYSGHSTFRGDEIRALVGDDVLPRLYDVSVTGYDSDRNALYTWGHVGSLYVPAPSSPIQRVDVVVPNPNVASRLTIRIETLGVTDEAIRVHVQGPGIDEDVDLSGSAGVYESELTSLPTPRFSNGRADITITTVPGEGDSTFPGGVRIARLAWFKTGGPLAYVGQDGYSALTTSGTTLSAEVRTRVLKFGAPTVIEPVFAGNDYAAGDFWADVFRGADLAEELRVATGSASPDHSWDLIPDVENGGDEDGNVDIGEILPSVGAGDHESRDQWMEALEDVEHAVDSGKTVTVIVPLVDPPDPPNRDHGIRATIQGFAAFNISSVDIDHDHNVSIAGKFVRYLAPGEWDDEKPPGGLYVETAVLTQ